MGIHNWMMSFHSQMFVWIGCSYWPTYPPMEVRVPLELNVYQVISHIFLVYSFCNISIDKVMVGYVLSFVIDLPTLNGRKGHKM
jgi:hypothetical protein